jgi:hypothetical protein
MVASTSQGKSVLVVLDVKALGGALAEDSVTLVCTEGSLGVGLAPGKEGRPGLLNVLRLAGPGLERALLEGTAEGEGQRPRLLGAELVHGVEVQGRLLLALPTGQEDDGGHGSGDGPLEGADGVLSDDLGRHLLGVRAWGDHVGLEEGTLEEDMVLVEGLVARSEDHLRDVGAAVDVVRAINKDLGLDDRHQPVLLADDGVASEALRIQINGELRRLVGADLEDGAPLGEAGTSLVVLGASLAKVIMALGGGLLLGAGNLDCALVHLDAREDTTLLEDIDEGLAILGLLVQGLLEEDHAAEVLEGARGAEEELAEGAAVLLNVLDVDAGEALANGASGLIRSKDTLARSANVGSVLDELVCKMANTILLTKKKQHLCMA